MHILCGDSTVCDSAIFLSVGEGLFDAVTGDHVDQVRKDYKEQIPSIFDKGMANDSMLLQVLAIGSVHGFDFLS